MSTKSASKWATDPIVTVCEATGLQGSSVVDTLLKQGKFRVRALTRKLDSPEAKELAEKGAEVFRCNPKKRRHLEKAFANSFAVFAVTDFFEKDVNSDAELEKASGLLMAEVAQDVGVHHYIWSSMPNVQALSNGEMDVRHFTAKNSVEHHIITHFEGFTTFVYAGIYCSSWTKHFLPTLSEDGVAEFGSGFLEDTQIPIFDVEDTGTIVAGIIANPALFDQRIVYMTAELLTVPQMAEIYTQVTGKPARYVRLDYEELEKRGMAKELIALIKWTNEYGYFHNKTEAAVAQTRQNFSNLHRFEAWLRDSGWTVGEHLSHHLQLQNPSQKK